MSQLIGMLDWSLKVDKDSHRDYTIKWLIEASSLTTGPGTIMATPGVPAVGATWSFGTDVFPWAFCWPDWEVTRFKDESEPTNLWTLSQTFSTKPLRRCQDTSIENPLSEPPRISGSFVKYVEEATEDRHGKALRNPAFERYRGAVVEFDKSRPTIDMEITNLSLPLSVYAPMIDTVNDAELWGLSKRMIKLSNASFKRLLYGTCSFYFVTTYNFEINFKTFDRKIPAEGTMCLHSSLISHETDIQPSTGKAYYLNPKNFVMYKDTNGENTRCFTDEHGVAVLDEDNIHIQTVEKYEESNFLELGVPVSF